MQLLAAHSICKHYGGIAALKHAHFAVRAGEVHALMGENGAGKSTLSKILAGSVRPDSGSIQMEGKTVSFAGPLAAQRLGIGIIYQELDLFPHLTIAENIAVGNASFAEGRIVSRRKLAGFCRPFLNQVGLTCSPETMVAGLSIGQMQLVAIARALSMNPRVILMDEPTSALTGDSVALLFDRIRELKQRGIAIVYVSHKLDEIFQVCDRVTVMRDGETIGTHEIAATNSAELIRMMVGRELEVTARQERAASQEIVLAVKHLTTAKLKDVSFELRRGEVLGIAGLVGAGRSELGAALAKLDRVMSGSFQVTGKPVSLVPEDRRLQGLMMQMSVLENSSLGVLGSFSKFGILHRSEEMQAVARLHDMLRLKAPSPDASVRTLSGGNQQKVLLSKCLLADPDVLFLDDPTRGIDVGAKQDIYGIIRDFAARGNAAILVSSELPELLALSDRILVMREGRIAAAFNSKHATQERIMAAATGSPL